MAKYCDHLPLYRQAQIFARNGIDLDRLTLASWVGRACWWLRPPAELLLGTILSSPKIFADDTPVPVLDPGRGRTKTGRPWAYARDDRPWRGPMPPAVAYVYSENRQGVHPRIHLPRRPGAGRVHSDRFSRCPVDRALALLSQVRTGLAGERTGFEPSGPRKRTSIFEPPVRHNLPVSTRGTEGSNPASSSGESVANLTSLPGRDARVELGINGRSACRESRGS